jgi:hypothetical protein
MKAPIIDFGLLADSRYANGFAPRQTRWRGALF